MNLKTVDTSLPLALLSLIAGCAVAQMNKVLGESWQITGGESHAAHFDSGQDYP
jgi:hypothetical protein